MAASRVWMRCTCCVLLFVCGVLVPAVLLLVAGNGFDDLSSSNSPFLASVRGFEGKGSSSHERKPLDYAEVEDTREGMEYQVQEMRQIVVSVRNELRELEKEREEVREAVDRSKTTLARVRKEVGSAKSSLQESKEKLAKVLREMKRANQESAVVQVTRSPVVVVNLPAGKIPEEGGMGVRGVAAKEEHKQGNGASRKASLDSMARGEPAAAMETAAAMDCFDELCFDYSRCSLTSKFLVYVYNQHFPDALGLRYPGVVDKLVTNLKLTHSLTSDPNLACIFIVITGPLKEELDPTVLHQKLQSLTHWKDGSNHVTVDLFYSNEQLSSVPLQRRFLGHDIEAGSYATGSERQEFDILIPPVTMNEDGDEPSWKKIPFLVPALRQVLVHFEGAAGESEGVSSPLGTHWISSRQLKTLGEAITSNTKDRVVLLTDCTGAREAPVEDGGGKPTSSQSGEWELCGTPRRRAHTLSQATFSLVIGSRTGIAGPVTYGRLMEGLRYGAVPVVFGLRHLPFGDVIDWKQAAVVLPTSSLGELHFILRNMDADTILKYRKQGRFLWETYFSSPLNILKTVVAVIRQRAKHPPPPANEYTPTNLVKLPGENRVILSQEFLYNFTSYTADFWNSPPGPFLMYPTTPFKPEPVSGSQYTNMDTRQLSNLPLHVVEGGGITGPFFEDYLLGNVPDEQFTVVVLTYERNNVLVDALLRLKDLDHLAKVVVVWNNPDLPLETMKWPEIGVPVDVSMENRVCTR